MPSPSNLLRQELAARNHFYARNANLRHVISRGAGAVVVYPPSPCGTQHGNFHSRSYAAMLANPTWRRRLDKAHTGKKKLPALDPEAVPGSSRSWCELDSSTSSDALLMNCFCYPGMLQRPAVQSLLGIAPDATAQFGFKARVPRTGMTGDATEIDLRVTSAARPENDLLIEAKLTESNFQQRDVAAVERYCDFDAVFDRELLPQARARMRLVHDHDLGDVMVPMPGEKYESYQMIRNVLAAHALGARLCVMIHAARTDLREQYHAVQRAITLAELRTRCTLLTWQELAAACDAPLRQFLADKYGIVAAR